MAKKLGFKEIVKKNIEQFSIDETVHKYLYLIADNTLGTKSERDAKNKLIRALFDEGFEMHDPSGTKKIGSKVIQQCLWRLMRKIKFLDYNINGTGKEDSLERLVTEGVHTVMERGDFDVAFGGKGGVFQNAALFGDGFVMFGQGNNDDNPVQFRALRNEDVYVDAFATGIRGTHPANRMSVIFEYDKEEAYEIWPELKEKKVYGRIPGTYQAEENDNAEVSDSDVVELAWAWNKSLKEHIIFAGSQAELVEEFRDEEYAFVKNNKPYIPVFQFVCQFGTDRSFWNHGIGDMVYDLAVITAKLLNMEVGHIEENVYPLTLINAPQDKVDELVEKMAMATKSRSSGKKSFVAMEFGGIGGSGQTPQAQTLLTNNLANEWQMVWDRLVKEIGRLGINIDDVDRGAAYTATQIYAEEMTQNEFVQQMMEYNAPETKEIVECTMDAITEYVSANNESELNLKTRITLPDNSTIKIDEKVTMGHLANELRRGNWFADVNKRSGADNSDLLKLTNLQQQLNVTPPGTPEFAEIYRQISYLRGINLELKNQPQGWQPPQQNANQQALDANMAAINPMTPARVTPDALAALTGSQQ